MALAKILVKRPGSTGSIGSIPYEPWPELFKMGVM